MDSNDYLGGDVAGFLTGKRRIVDSKATPEAKERLLNEYGKDPSCKRHFDSKGKKGLGTIWRRKILTMLPGITEKNASLFEEIGVKAPYIIAKLKPDKLIVLKGIGKKKAEAIVKEAKRFVKLWKSPAKRIA